MFVSNTSSNVWRALAGRITKDKFREGGNMADWARCVCHMLHSIVSHELSMLNAHATTNPKSQKLSVAFER